MESVVKTVNLGKESSEMVDLIAAVIEDVRLGKSLPEIAARLPQLVVAIEGYNLVGEETKLAWNGTAGYLVYKVGAALMVQKPEAPAELPQA